MLQNLYIAVPSYSVAVTIRDALLARAKQCARLARYEAAFGKNRTLHAYYIDECKTNAAALADAVAITGRDRKP